MALAAPTSFRFIRPRERPNRTINLAWNANPASENVTGYSLYYGNATGTYNGVGSPISVGNVTSYAFVTTTFSGIFMAITATNATGESTFSNEVYT